MLRAADGAPGGDRCRLHPAALQPASTQAVGALTHPPAVDTHTRTRIHTYTVETISSDHIRTQTHTVEIHTHRQDNTFMHAYIHTQL